MNSWLKSKNFSLCLIYINVIIYATCFQIQRPLEPFLVSKLLSGENSAMEYAKLQSFFSIMQTIGSLITGLLLDKFGVKGGFIISFGSSALSYWMLSQATTMRILYLSKIPTIFQAGFLCAQVAIAHRTNDGSERVQALGRLTMSYTIGSVIGPALGGWLGASGDYYFAAKLSALGSLISVVLALMMPSEQHSSVTAAVAKKEKNNDSGGSTSRHGIYFVLRLAWLLLSTKVITSVANAMHAAALPLVLKNVYGMQEQGLGNVMALMSACNTVVNGLLLAPLVALFGGSLVLVIGYSVIVMTGLFGLQCALALPGFMPPAYTCTQYITTTFLLSGMQYVLSTSITSESTARVGQSLQGTLIGLEHSLFAAARVFAPQLGVTLLSEGGASAVAGACAGVFSAVWLLWTSCSGGHSNMSNDAVKPKSTSTTRTGSGSDSDQDQSSVSQSQSTDMSARGLRHHEDEPERKYK